MKTQFEHLLQSPLLAGCMLLVTAAILFYTARLDAGDRRYQDLSYAQALGIGIAQALAILPGISRSGTTICAGMRTGLRQVDAAAFSFLLAIPAIGGACVLELKDLVEGAAIVTPYSHLVVGAAVAAVVGWFSLWWLLRVLEGGRLQYFGYWCVLVGVAVILMHL